MYDGRYKYNIDLFNGIVCSYFPFRFYTGIVIGSMEWIFLISIVVSAVSAGGGELIKVSGGILPG